MTQLQDILKDSGCWKTEAEFFQWLRGWFRMPWKRHPVRVNYLKQKRYKWPESVRGDTRWLVDCELCSEPKYIYRRIDGVLQPSEIEVDHKLPSGSFKTMEDMVQFIYKLLFISFEDLRCLCKDCHGIVTLANKLGVTFEEAKIEKEVINFSRHMPAQRQCDLLEEMTGHSWKGSNAKDRKDSYRELLKHVY